MEATKNDQIQRDGTNLLWVVVMQTVAGVLIVGVQVFQHWHTWRLLLRVMSLFVLLMLVLAPGGELLRTPPLQTYTAEAAVPHDGRNRADFG